MHLQKVFRLLEAHTFTINLKICTSFSSDLYSGYTFSVASFGSTLNFRNEDDVFKINKGNIMIAVERKKGKKPNKTKNTHTHTKFYVSNVQEL